MKVVCVDFALRTLSMLARDRGIGRRCRFNSFGRFTPLTPLTVPTGTWLRAGPLESHCSVHRQKEQWDGHGWPMANKNTRDCSVYVVVRGQSASVQNGGGHANTIALVFERDDPKSRKRIWRTNFNIYIYIHISYISYLSHPLQIDKDSNLPA